jgi:carboxymethylenebutenolidase
MTSYKGHTGTLEAYVSRPAETDSRPAPAVIVIQKIWGLDDHIKDVTRRFAAQGYVAFAPNLYSGEETIRSTLTRANIDEAVEFVKTIDRRRMRDQAYLQEQLSKLGEKERDTIGKTIRAMFFGGIPEDRLVQDLVRAVEYLRSSSFVENRKVAGVGFCFGGGMSINLACHAKTNACVIFYGKNPSPIELVSNIYGPVMGLYGGEDERISSAVDQLVKAMVQSKKDFEMRIYPGAMHAFFNDTSKATYNADAARDAWDRVLRFLSRTLKSPAT